MSMIRTVEELIAAAGSAAKLAEHSGVCRPTVYGWLRRGRVPMRHVKKISAALAIPPEQISPEIAEFMAEDAA